jgi:hypothetical protein
VAPVLGSLAATTINENGTTTLTGTITDPGTLDTFTLDVNWGDSASPNNVEQVTFTAGTTSFTLTHQYLDDNTNTIGLTLTDDDTGAATADTTVVVNNVAPTIDLSASPLTHNESGTTSYTLTLGAITDPGADTVTQMIVFWGDNTSDQYTTLGSKTHIYDDDASYSGPISVTLLDEDGFHAGAGTHALVVNNVAPTATLLTGGAVSEGSTGVVVVAGQSDASNTDSTAGFTYDYDFNNNSTIETGLGEISDTTSTSATVPAQFLDDDPSKTIRVIIRDKDGGETAIFSTITVNNVAPVVDAGSDALLVDQTQAFAGVPFVQAGSFTDPGADNWTAEVDYDFSGAGTFQSLVLTGKTFELNHTYATTGTFTIRVRVDDGDGGVDTDDVTVEVGENTLRVIDFAPNHSGFDMQFNDAIDLTSLNLYDGTHVDGSLDVADLVLVYNGTETINGSMVWDATTNTLGFVKTGGALASGSYEVTLTSSADAFQDTSGNLLDGDSDLVSGGDFIETFTASNGTTVVSLPDFARGAGQDVNIPATTPGAGLPISVDVASGVTALDLDVVHNPNLLNISSASLASGLPSDWGITQNMVSAGVLKLTASGTTPLSGTDVNIFILNADVPATAPYGDSQIIRLDNVRVNEDQIASRADFAMHKAIYLGDTDGNAVYTGFDSALISRVVVLLDSGYDEHNWTDPVIVSDATADGTLSGLDASFVAQKSVLLARPEIPDLPGIVVVPGEPGIDPELNIDAEIPGVVGGTTTVSVELDNVSAAISATYDVLYDDASLAIDNGDVNFGSAWPQHDGWSLQANVVTPGHLRVTMFNSNSSATGQGDISALDFTLKATAPAGTTPLDIEPVDPNEGGLLWTESDGSILVVIDPSPNVTLVTRDSGNDTFDTLDTLTFTFDEAVNVSAASLTLSNETAGGTPVDLTGVTFTYDAANLTATWDFTGVAGMDAAFYMAVLHATLVTDSFGNQLDGDGNGTGGDDLNQVLLVAQKGDVDVDGDVDLADYNILAANFDPAGNNSSHGWCDANFDGDFDVDLTDYNALVGNFEPVGYAGTPPLLYVALGCDLGTEPLSSAAPLVSASLAVVDEAEPGNQTPDVQSNISVDGSATYEAVSDLFAQYEHDQQSLGTATTSDARVRSLGLSLEDDLE